MKRRHAIILISVLLIPVLLVGFYWHGLRKLTRGYETKPAEEHSYLNQVLNEDLGFDRLQVDWIDSSWTNGFREHTRLYKLSIPPTDLEILKESFRSGTESGAVNRSATHLCDGAYLGPSTAPDWWETEQLDSLPQLVHLGDSRDWRLTAFGNSYYLLIADW